MTTAWESTKDQRIKLRDGKYWARFMKRGRRVEQSLETKNFEVAKRLVEEIEGKILLGRSWKREKQLFSEAWLEFILDKADGNKVRPARASTIREYSKAYERYFKPFFGDRTLSEVDAESWVDFIKWAKAEFGEIQFFNPRKYFMGFLTWAKRHEKILTPPYLLDPDAAKNKEKEEFTPGKAFTKDELQRLRDESKKHPRFHLVMLMAQYMGMRPSEITQLLRERVDLEQNVINLKRADTKTNSGRRVPIHPLVLPLLKDRLLGSAKSDYLFPNRNDQKRPMDRQGFKKVWWEIMDKAEVEGRFYDFRHTFITNAIASGMNPAIVAKITGTSLRVIEKYYLHLSNDDLNRAMKRFKL